MECAVASPAAVRRGLLAWYRRHGRTLPWRARAGEKPDAYRVWVSEVMLQQTRVETVIPYYARFLKQFPTLRRLASASEDRVLAAWSGLGYYRRARDLHRAAQAVVRQHGGRIPLEWEALRALPGVGDYTAGAILSIADGQRFPAPDGNAFRIVRRIAGAELAPAEARRALADWVPAAAPGDFNQALMDLGATVCTARAPQCGRCPLRPLCAGAGARLAPVRGKTAKGAKSTTLYLAYLLGRRRGEVALVQRAATEDWLPGMWELPAAGEERGELLGRFRHRITRYAITADVFAGRRGGKWIGLEAAMGMPLTGLCRKILEALG